MNPAVAIVLKDVGQAVIKAARKPLAKLLRKRAAKLRKKANEKDSGIDTSGNA